MQNKKQENNFINKEIPCKILNLLIIKSIIYFNKNYKTNTPELDFLNVIYFKSSFVTCFTLKLKYKFY